MKISTEAHTLTLLQSICSLPFSCEYIVTAFLSARTNLKLVRRWLKHRCRLTDSMVGTQKQEDKDLFCELLRNKKFDSVYGKSSILLYHFFVVSSFKRHWIFNICRFWTPVKTITRPLWGAWRLVWDRNATCDHQRWKATKVIL